MKDRKEQRWILFLFKQGLQGTKARKINLHSSITEDYSWRVKS